MSVTKTTHVGSGSGSLWLCVMLAVVICMSIDALLIVALVERLDAWHVIVLAFIAAMLETAIFGTAIRFNRLSDRSEE